MEIGWERAWGSKICSGAWEKGTREARRGIEEGDAWRGDGEDVGGAGGAEARGEEEGSVWRVGEHGSVVVKKKEKEGGLKGNGLGGIDWRKKWESSRRCIKRSKR